MTYINHLTINTGDLRRSPRAEVDDYAIRHTRSLIARALDARCDMPVPGYQLSGARYGPALVLTIWGGEDPLATLAIAARDRDGRSLWRDLLAQVAQVYPAAAPEAPPAPFVAAVLWPPLALEADAAEWIGDFGRVAAWSWLERADD